MNQEIIKIKGMHCKSCVELIETKLSSLEGIEAVKVNLAKDEAEIRFDSNKISLEKIKSEINKLGYSTEDKEDQEQKKKGKSFLQGLMYGLIPHIGCIAFIIGSILGVTVLMNFFKPLLMNRYFFHALVGISLGFATLSSAFYLKRNGLLSLAGIKKKWKYLSIMYGSTIGINLLLFMLIFPLLANVSVGSSSITGAAIGIVSNENTDSLLKLKVDIPCPGHAPLISQELKTIKGVTGIKFSFPNYFDVTYNSAETSKQEMLALDVFNSYPAIVVSESIAEQNIQEENNPPASGSCCGGGGTCGSTGGCGCGSY
ncbi:MAG: heavy-metal-associated domain-containing protein [Nanoarchaeota archaeon]|nr:heavy metal translocating P-type ATPase [Nanoarchaeota archaeon]MBU1631754.1 heavy metal translocating P-type ATPase [Nanoarchaeota archaeon]MBU1876050.1 heavy metal translocating P-type ATPase [Nanoarchaeota archaeon]